MRSFLDGLSCKCQISLKLKLIKSSLIWDQSGICGSSRLEMRALQRRIFKIKITIKELLLQMLISFQIDVVAQIFNPNPWNLYTKNRSLRALWIFFHNFFFAFIEEEWRRFLISNLAWNTLYLIKKTNIFSTCYM